MAKIKIIIITWVTSFNKFRSISFLIIKSFLFFTILVLESAELCIMYCILCTFPFLKRF